MIIAPNHFSFMDHFFVGAFIRRRVRFMAKSQLFARPMQFVYTHGGVFPVRRGYRDEEAFITANSILERGGLIVMYCEGGRSRTGKLSEQPKRGIGRLALESGATVVPAAIHGSSKVRNWKRLQFPKVTVQYGEPMRWEAVAEPTADQQQQVANEIFAQIRGLYAGLDSLGPQGRRPRRLREARRARAPARSRYRLTSSQLAAIASSASANTTSVPGPAVDAVDGAVDLGDAVVALAALDRVAVLGAGDRRRCRGRRRPGRCRSRPRSCRRPRCRARCRCRSGRTSRRRRGRRGGCRCRPRRRRSRSPRCRTARRCRPGRTASRRAAVPNSVSLPGRAADDRRRRARRWPARAGSRTTSSQLVRSSRLGRGAPRRRRCRGRVPQETSSALSSATRTLSLPRPPKTSSSPGPPMTVSAPLPPETRSSSEPPSNVSAPSEP